MRVMKMNMTSLGLGKSWMMWILELGISFTVPEILGFTDTEPLLLLI
jgi:hypothetical protein